MWIAKLFSGFKRRDEDETGEEPARFPAESVSAESPRTDFNKRRARESSASKPGAGFDPYNSGTFKKDDAWNRVTRR